MKEDDKPHKASHGIDLSKYCINLMWINAEKNKDSTFIANGKTESTFKTDIITPVIEWAKANPEATINLWYDSAHTTENAIKKTNDSLKDQLEKAGVLNVKMRDVRDIPCVKNNPDIFTEGIPIYFRVDLLKLIVLLHAIADENADSAIFSDLEVGDLRPSKDRMNKEELFTPEVRDGLNRIGLVTNKNDIRRENQFLYLYKNPFILDAVRLSINTNFSRVMKYLTDPRGQCRNIGELNTTVYATMFNEIADFFNALQTNAQLKYFTLGVQGGVYDGRRVVDDMKEYTYDEQQYAPWAAYSQYGFSGLGTIRYYLEGEKFPAQLNYSSFIPQRDMTSECREGHHHEAPPCEPTPLKEYRCEFLEYQTLEACVALKKFTGQQIVLYIIENANIKLGERDPKSIQLEEIAQWANFPRDSGFLMGNKLGACIRKTLIDLGMKKDEVVPGKITAGGIKTALSKTLSSKPTIESDQRNRR